MNNVDMIAWHADGASRSRVVDYYSEGYFTPEVDAQQDIKYLAELKGDRVFFRAARKLDTGDPKDYLIRLNEELPLVWAVQG